MNRPPAYRHPLSRLAFLGMLALIAAVPLGLRSFFGNDSGPEDVLTCRATREPFVHEISVKGQVESAVNVDVACEVKSRDSAWIRILEVVPEGTRVQPGDFLVRLDSSLLEDERNRQQLAVEESRARVAQARSRLSTAEYNREHYLRGEYALARKDAEIAVFNAQEQVRQAKQALEASRKLLAEGFVTPKQFQADEFGLKRAETELGVARLKLSVLDGYTRMRRLIELESAVVAAKARLASAESILKRNEERLADIEEQIKKCVLRAPVAGEVVLNHLHQEDHSHMVAPGELTMERRVLVRLPDPRHMQVKAFVTEDKIAAVQPGVRAAIELEAFPHIRLKGQVIRVNEYPEPDSFMGTAIKKYQTIVRIDNPIPGMRPGLTAQVSFSIQQSAEQIQVPCQAVFKHGDQNYCICVEGDAWEARPVTLGPTNGKMVVIREGLEEGQRVVLCAAAHRDEVGMPEVPATSAPLEPTSENRLARREAGS
ncbi:MAG: efflux RND transporter periplasmic adaptor subunit [Thermoguttaceae bacterium]|jgi:multidrug efflux pump subunit AcrA (membrane-fusion protein)|nr:efflux RND transporter periplasmic adaptor subunit [Thermoguttaceae bacterium]